MTLFDLQEFLSLDEETVRDILMLVASCLVFYISTREEKPIFHFCASSLLVFAS